MIDKKNHRPAFALLPAAVAAALCAFGAPAQAACTDTGAAATATSGSVCGATGAIYANGVYALASSGNNSVLTTVGAVSLNPGSNLTAGGRAVASADGGGGRLVFNGNVSLNQRGANNSYGLSAGNVTPGGFGTVEVNGDVNVVMAAQGSTRRAIMSLLPGSLVTITGHTTISMTGAGTHRGFSAEEGGIIRYRSASIDFAGDSGATAGIRVIAQASEVHASGDTEITVDSADSVGVSTLGKAIFTGKLTVNAGGANAAAVNARGTGELAMGAASSLSNPTGNAVVLGSGTPTFTAGSGLVVSGGTNGFAYNGVTASTITLNNATVTAPNLWNATSSVATFNGAGGVYTGASTKDAASTLNVNLNAAALWNLTDDATLTAATLTSGAVLSAPTASRTLTGQLANTAGVLDLHGAAPGTTGQVFTVSGDYSGGGTMRIDTQLGDDGSPTDALTVTGAVSGVTTLQVTNVAGLGAETVGNGIPVVRVGGASPAGAFVLAGPGYVQAGTWRYTLVQVGRDWFLQSQRALPPTAVPTLSGWALLALSPLMLLIGRRRGARRA